MAASLPWGHLAIAQTSAPGHARLAVTAAPVISASTDTVSLEAELRRTREQLDRIRERLDAMSTTAPRLRRSTERIRASVAPIPRSLLDESRGALSLGFLTEFAESLGARLDTPPSSASGHDENWDDTDESALHVTDCWVPTFVGDSERQHIYHARRLQEFEMPGGAPVRVSHSYGDVIVEPGDGARLAVYTRVSLQWQGTDGDAVSHYLEAIQVSAVRRGDSLVVVVTRPPARPVGISQIGLDLTVRVPAGHAIVVGSSYGDVVLRGLSAPLGARTSFGDVEVVRTSGPLTLASQNGDVVVRRHIGPLIVDNANGAVNLVDVSGDVRVTGRLSDVFGRRLAGTCVLDLRGGSGFLSDLDGTLNMSGERAALEARDVSGRVVLTSDLGDVRLARLRAGASVHVRRGSLEMEECAGDVQLEARDAFARIQDPSGQLRLNSVRGDVVVDARDAVALRHLSADATDGSIVAYVPPRMPATVRVGARDGQIMTDLPMSLISTPDGGQHGSAIFGSGAIPVTLHATAGSVFLYAGTRMARDRTPRARHLPHGAEGPHAVPVIRPER